LAGKCRSNSIVASTPPADPPTPTIGQLKFFLADFDLDFALPGFDRDDFVLLGFLRPRGAALLILRLAGIALIMLAMPSASYKM